MNTQIQELLHCPQEYPSISVIIPTPTTNFETVQGHIHLKKEVVRVVGSLMKEYPQPELVPVFTRLTQLIDEHDFTHVVAGVALFANESYATVVPLTFRIKEFATVGSVFAVSEVYDGTAHESQYWVLSVSDKETRLYEAHNKILTEIISLDAQGNPIQGFPLQDLGPQEHEYKPIASGERNADYLDNHKKVFLKMVDNELGKILKKKPLPVVVCCTVKNKSLFDGVTTHTKDIVAYKTADYTHNSAYEVGQAVWPVVQELFVAQEKKTIAKFEEAIGSSQQAFGLHRVWEMACAGRIDVLLLERDFKVYGTVDASTPTNVIVYEKNIPSAGVDNLIDVLLIKVHQQRGKIVFVAKDALQEFEHVGAILRY